MASLRATGRQVFAINPLSVSRYRDRHSLSGKKSDSGDALVLAHILRTELPAHRPLPVDSELAQAIAVLARAQQDAVRDRQQLGNRLRSLLLDSYPAAVAAFAGLSHGGLTRPDARAVLTLAPSPTKAAVPHPRPHRRLTSRRHRLSGASSVASTHRDLEAPGPCSGPGRPTCRASPTTLHDEEPSMAGVERVPASSSRAPLLFRPRRLCAAIRCQSPSRTSASARRDGALVTCCGRGTTRLQAVRRLTRLRISPGAAWALPRRTAPN